MIHSMTSFARRECATAYGSLRWELRSVNHRYLDISLKLPEELRAIEPRARERIGDRIGRGKVEALLRYQPIEILDNLIIDPNAVRRLAGAMTEVTALVPQATPPGVLDLLRWPGIVQAHEVEQEPLLEEAMSLLELTLTDMVEHRCREGGRLQALIQQRCASIEALVAEVRARLPELRRQLHERLRGRAADLGLELESGRLEQELALLLQKADVDEELDRLAAHIHEVRHVLGRREPVGRRLDFLMQELHREANTLASKSVETDIIRISVDLKVLIEQMREQVQNIE